MQLGELLTIIGLLIANAGFLYGMWKFLDGKIDRVYQRLDEVKDSFVRKDMCALLHQATVKDIADNVLRIEKSVEKLEGKVEAYFKQILERLDKE